MDNFVCSGYFEIFMEKNKENCWTTFVPAEGNLAIPGLKNDKNLN
jgi:hypothetical protein